MLGITSIKQEPTRSILRCIGMVANSANLLKVKQTDVDCPRAMNENWNACHAVLNTTFTLARTGCAYAQKGKPAR